MASDFYIPKTISAEAQSVLNSFTFANRDVLDFPEPDDLEGWKKIQQMRIDAFGPVNEKVKKEYQPTIEEKELGGIPVLDIKPKGWKDNGKLLVYTHGGGYTQHNVHTTLPFSVCVADKTGLNVIAIDYTLAPLAKHDQMSDQVVAVFKALLEQGRKLENIALYGDSAGGGLASGSVLKMRDQGVGMPAALVLWSPWADIDQNCGDSYFALRDIDPLLSYENELGKSALACADPKDWKNPYVCSVYGDFSKGYPPTFIQVGTKEIFLSCSIRLYHALNNAGQTVKLELFDGMWHVFQGLNYDIPESETARENMAKFLKEYLKY
ncbi:alpha/beta hydrolase [Roseofilum capinflatum]|uniref:Alpha/beta hydrolase n=1 Tax=Roseofilum capinflatum BLCC-M114 TaxID=3022440 RepID=A0ABT7B4P4_9CYAN|nr:alpha/beta hydrolase [Roseofilum capinflatum]MDJ1174129.1 alpha/beta hydrolase [Roseofilum capinflatum BLCC-M114]